MRRLKVSGGRIKKSIIGVALALILANFVPFFNRAYADQPTNINDYVEILMTGATGFTESTNTFTFANGTVVVSGTTDQATYLEHDHNFGPGQPIADLYHLYTKSTSVTFTLSPAENHTAEVWLSGTKQTVTNNTYTATGLETRGTANGQLGYNFDFPFPETNNNTPQQGNTPVNITYTYSNGITRGPEEDAIVEMSINGREINLVGQDYTSTPSGKRTTFSDTYNVGPSDTTVNFEFRTLFIYVADTLTVNGTNCLAGLDTSRAGYTARYSNQHNIISCTVPKSSTNTYEIISNVRFASGEDEQFMGNFLWDNDDNSTTAAGDDIIGHGSLEFVSVKYNGVTYNSVEELNAANNLHFEYSNSNVPGNTDGGMALPVGAELTVRLLPEPGYQLTSFGINGGEFDPQANVGEYTFEIKPGNGHLAAQFTKVDDEVVADADAIESGSITLGGAEGSIDMGTAKLSVDNVELEPVDIDGFNNAAGDYKVSTFLDISLYKTVYKGSLVDSWDEKIDELENEATITLTLEEGIDGNEVVIVHQKHDGTYEVIPSVYDPVARTITFKTSSFSNYAIASRTVAAPDTGFFLTESGSALGSTAGTFILAITIVSSLYIASYYLALEKQNQKK